MDRDLTHQIRTTSIITYYGLQGLYEINCPRMGYLIFSFLFNFQVASRGSHNDENFLSLLVGTLSLLLNNSLFYTFFWKQTKWCVASSLLFSCLRTVYPAPFIIPFQVSPIYIEGSSMRPNAHVRCVKSLLDIHCQPLDARTGTRDTDTTRT